MWRLDSSYSSLATMDQIIHWNIPAQGKVNISSVTVAEKAFLWLPTVCVVAEYRADVET